MNLKAKQFFYIMVAATALGFGGIIGAFYWGDSLLVKKAQTIADLQTDRDVAQEKIIALQRTKQGSDVVEETNKLLDNLLPTTKNQETLVADVIYTASAEAEIPSQAISALSFSNSSEPSNLSGTEQFKEVSGVFSYPFNMTVTDISYETLLKLLMEIENNGRLVQIDDIQISPDKNIPGNISGVSLTMKAFLKP